MPIERRYTPVAGVGQLARRAGQQQQAVREQAYGQQWAMTERGYEVEQGFREQGFQWEQDLMGLRANLQQKRDTMLNQYQQQRDTQLQQYETEQLERRYRYLSSQARRDRKHQEEMAELEIELYKDRQKFDIQLENEQYVAKRKFDFDQELQGLAAESQFRMQLEQQKTMGNLAEQQMKTQQKERETEAAIKAIQENAYLSPEEQERAITAYQTKQTSMMKPTKNVALSNEALRIASTTNQDPSHVQWALDTAKQLPQELRAPYWSAFNNPDQIPQFHKLYEAWWDSETQKLAGEYGLVPNREQIIGQRMKETGAPREIVADDRLFKQWNDLGWPRNQAMLGLGAGIKAYAKSQVAPDKQRDFNKALNDFISANEKLEDYATKGAMTEAVTGKESKVVRALELKRDRALDRMRKIDPIATQNIQSQIEQVTPAPEMTDAEKRAELKRRGWTNKQIDDALAGK